MCIHVSSYLYVGMPAVGPNDIVRMYNCIIIAINVLLFFAKHLVNHNKCF